MDSVPKLREQLDCALAECRRLRQEIGRLERLLAASGIDPTPPPVVEPVPEPLVQTRTQLKPQEKVALFRSLFRGREDVYAVRWESPDGRHGYMPKSERDWKAYYAAKPEDRKRVDKEARKYFPLTDQAVHDHLAGKHTMGVYPSMRDETCWFLAVDFDKKTWEDDTTAFLETCGTLRVPAALERSRSGKGGHVWIFSNDRFPQRSRESSGR